MTPDPNMPRPCCAYPSDPSDPNEPGPVARPPPPAVRHEGAYSPSKLSASVPGCQQRVSSTTQRSAAATAVTPAGTYSVVSIQSFSASGCSH